LLIRWIVNILEELLRARDAYLFPHQYKKSDAQMESLLPSHLGSSTTIEWLTKRTLMRPRDIIVYMNMCLEREA